MSEAARILFVEDDPSGRELGEFNLSRAGYGVDTAANGQEGLDRFDAERHALVITDVRMPGVSGMEVLAEIKRRSPATPVIVITAYGNIELAVEAMKAGAFDFIGKPFNREHLLLTVQRALENRELRAEVDALRIKATGVEGELVCRSAVMNELLALADRAARSDAPVLISGEHGTGKELVARRVHVKSDRARGPFVVVRCAAMGPEASTRALSAAIERAQRGTLFLDEITSLDDADQRRLLSVLEEGGVRLVASTHEDLDAAVEGGRLREDLRHRLEVLRLEVPPLRERIEDVEPLLRHFVRRAEPGREAQVTAELIAAAEARAWPANVRGLENAVERVLLLSPDDALSVEHLAGPVRDEVADPFSSWPELPEDGLSLVDLERRVIERVLRLKGGNVSQAAAYLRVPRHVLAYRMEKYGIPRKG